MNGHSLIITPRPKVVLYTSDGFYFGLVTYRNGHMDLTDKNLLPGYMINKNYCSGDKTIFLCGNESKDAIAYRIIEEDMLVVLQDFSERLDVKRVQTSGIAVTGEWKTTTQLAKRDLPVKLN